MRAAGVLLVACGLLAGCGGSDKDDADRTPAPKPADVAKNPEAEPGGAGDEAGHVQRVRLTVRRDRALIPRRVKVSAFLATDVAFRNRSARAQVISVTAAGAKRAVQAPPRRTVTMHVEGLRPGAYRIAVAGGGRASLVAAADTP
jgi:hypothetical protein